MPARRDHDGVRSTARDGSGGLHVGLVAPPWLPVPPLEYGGTELVVDQLARGLVDAGCRVSLVASGDSTCPVQRRAVRPSAMGVTNESAVELGHVQSAYAVLGDVDVVHDHTVLGPLWWAAGQRPAPRRSPPVVTTTHGAYTPEMTALHRRVGDRIAVVAISEAQRRSAPEVRVRAVIHHGIDTRAYPPGRGDGDFVLFLGRMAPEKGAHRAILAARAAGRRILLAAKMREPAEQRYFREQVRPLLGSDAVYVGEVGHDRKVELLGAAAALLNPIRWNEPFGLVMVEAFACGTPVLSFAEGSAPEIVEHGRTGFLCCDEPDMAERISQLTRIDRDECRAVAVARFSTQRMVADHLSLYRRLVAHPAPPRGAARPRRTARPVRGGRATRPGGNREHRGVARRRTTGHRR